MNQLNEEILHRINRKLLQYNWNDLHNLTVDECYEIMTKRIVETIDEYAPEKNENVNQKNIPYNCWMTAGLLKSQRKNNILYGKAKGKDNSTVYQNY